MLNGAGVTVGQVEADFAADQFEVNPAAVGQPRSLFTYFSPAGSVSGVGSPNVAGTESGHADTVGYALAFNFARSSTSASNPQAPAAIASAANVSPPPVYALPTAQLQWQTGGDQGDGGLGVWTRK